MDGELFDSTIPFGEPELLKATAYRRYLNELDDASPNDASRMMNLSPSLQADLQRADVGSGASETVEVIAACVRHSTRVIVYFQCADRVLPLTLFPHERLVHCPMPMHEFVERYLPQARVMHLEPATLRPPGDPDRDLIGESRLYHPLSPLLWELAMRGPRRELLPEISGSAAYRVAPGLTMATLPVTGAIRSAIERLRNKAVPLTSLATWPAFDRERAARLLNALYLQAGLIVSRSHPDAAGEGWF